MFSSALPPYRFNRPAKSRDSRHRLWAAIEPLETRVLMAGGPTFPAPSPFSFEAPTIIALPTNATGTGITGGIDRPFGGTLQLVDLNGDGKPDIIFEGNAGLTVLLNNGDGTFKPAVIYPTHSPGGLVYSGLSLADVNGDGHLDAVLVFSQASNKGPNGTPGNVDVLIGNTNGTFKPEQVYYNTGPNSNAITVGDFDITGKAHEEDIAVTNIYNRTVTIIAGNGNGTFVNSNLASNGATALGGNFASLSVGNEPESIVSYDVNGDGKADLVVGNEVDSTLSVLVNESNGNGKANFLPQFATPYGGDVETLTTNGKTFLAVSGTKIITKVSSLGVSYSTESSGLYLPTTPTGGEKPTFSRYTYGDGDANYAQVFGDGQTVPSNERGQLSLLFGNYLNATAYVDVGTSGFTVSGDKTYSTIGVYSNVTANAVGNTPAVIANTVLGYGPVGEAAADLNGDGFPDIVVADYGFNSGNSESGGLNRSPALTIFFGQQDGTFTGTKLQETGDGEGSLVGDGVDPAGYPVNKTVVGTNNYPNSFLVQDINGDNLDDIVSANYGTPPSGKPLKVSNYAGSVSIFLNQGDGNLPLTQIITGINGPDAVAVADLAGDGVPDLLVLDRFDGTLDVFKGYNSVSNPSKYGYSTGLFPQIPTATYSVGNHPESLAVGDVNGDGKMDVVVASYGSPYASKKYPGAAGSITVLLNNGYGQLNVGQTITDEYGPTGVVVGKFGNTDLAGDGVADIAVTNHLSVLEGVAYAGTGTAPGTGTLGYAGTANSVQFFVGNGDGTFQTGIGSTDYYGVTTYTPRTIPVGQGPTQILAANLDGAGKPTDLVVLNQLGESLTILGGNGDGTFFTQQVYDFPFNVPGGNPLKPNEKDSAPVNIAVGNITGDNKPEIVVDYAGTDGNLSNKIGIMLQSSTNGSNLFLAPILVNNVTYQIPEEELPLKNPVVFKPVLPVPIAVAVGDFNGDGLEDIATLDSTTAKYNGVVSILLNTASNTTTATAPVIASVNAASFTVGSNDSFTIKASGFPAPTLTETGALPSGLTFTSNGDGTATIAGTPTASATGTYVLMITATSSVGASAPQTLTLTVNAAITSVPHATFTIGTTGSFTVTTSGLGGSPSLFPFGNLPAGVTFTDNGNGTGTFAGKPAAGTQGFYDITIEGDGDSGSAEQSFILSVNLAGAVSINSNSSTTFVVGTTGTFAITTTGFTGTVSISKSGTLPAGVTFTDNGGGNATLAGKPAAGTQGSYSITITATNGTTTAMQTFTLTVAASGSAAITSANNTTFTVGTPGTFTMTTTGISGTVTFSKTGSLPSGVTLSSSGVLSGTPAAGSQGSYPITVTSTNGTTSATQNFTLTVAAASGSATITSASSTTFTVGTPGTFSVTTSGISGTVTVTESGSLPSGVTLSSSGVLSGTPATGSQGSYPITITATNGSGSTATQSFTLTVAAVSGSGSITSANSTTFTVGSAGTFSVTTTGISGTVTVTESGSLPSGVTLSSSGVLSGTPAAGTQGSYPITITATNGSGSTATQSFTLTVAAASGSGAITSGSSTSFVTGSPGTFTLTTSGFTGTVMLTSAGSLPSGVTFTDNGDGTATLSGTPADGTQGAYPLTFTATDGITTQNQSFTLNVFAASSSPPTITSNAGLIVGTGTMSSDVASLSINGSNLVVTIDAVSASFPLGSVVGIQLSLLGGTDSVTIGPGVPAALVNGGGGNDTIVAGNSAADTLIGGVANDSIAGGSGSALLQGGAGNDTLVAGSGNETLQGQGGADSMTGGAGTDLLVGGNGSDTLTAGTGRNTLQGANGTDSLIGGVGAAQLDGGPGADTIEGGPNDTILSDSSDTIIHLG